jgi:hypothetical protein
MRDVRRITGLGVVQSNQRRRIRLDHRIGGARRNDSYDRNKDIDAHEGLLHLEFLVVEGADGTRAAAGASPIDGGLTVVMDGRDDGRAFTMDSLAAFAA